MGERTVRAVRDGEDRRRFVRQLLDDLRALERMIEGEQFERGFKRIGAEQEIFLVDEAMRPAPAVLEILRVLDDSRFTTELGLFQIELNADPLPCGGGSLSRLQAFLDESLGRLRAAASSMGVHPVLAGILPTLRISDLGLASMTPLERYSELNRAMTTLRGGAYELHIRGLDELLLQHDSVMLEACTGSFQVHLQVGAAEFTNVYNAAQLAAAPVLAAACASPLLFGRQLWSETRIALFQQAVDTRSSMRFLRERSPRVTFGDSWLRNSVMELFHEDASRFRILLTGELGEDPLQMLDRGEVPELLALRLFNGTVYRWNRACYGITEGRPHLRIENRVMPAGPSVVDEVANAALWIGLVTGLAARHREIAAIVDFEEAKTNFMLAARQGLSAALGWFGETMPAPRLIAERVVPLAREGLAALGFDEADVERYLGVVDKRVAAFQGGAQWYARSLASMRRRGNAAERMTALTSALIDNQRTGRPVAEWSPAQIGSAVPAGGGAPRVEQYMSTDLFTVGEEEALDLVANVMEWKRIRHVPVEDERHRLVGLISYRQLLRLVARGIWPRGTNPLSARDVMHHDPITIHPQASILEAIDLMRARRISCLPVVEEGALVGVLTERDLMGLAVDVLELRLRSPGAS